MFSFPDNKSLSSQKLGQILPKLEFASARTGPTGLADRADRLNLYDLVGPTIIKTRSSIYLYLTHSSLSLSPSLSLTSPLSHPNPRLQIPHPKSISRPWEHQIRVKDHLPHIFLPGEPWIPSSLRGEGSSKVYKVCFGLISFSRMIGVIPFGQSSP